MMTSNHKAPSIEMVRHFAPDKEPHSPPAEAETNPQMMNGRSGASHDVIGSEPNEDVPHVMISLALEEDQRLDVNAWESWLAAFPAIAKYVKVQGVFKSHSTLLLLSLPVMIWDVLPDHVACNFVGFIRSGNLANQSHRMSATIAPVFHHTLPSGSEQEAQSIMSDTTLMSSDRAEANISGPTMSTLANATQTVPDGSFVPRGPPMRDPWLPGTTSGTVGRRRTAPTLDPPTATSSENVLRNISDQPRNSRNNVSMVSDNVTSRPGLAPHIQTRLEAYFQENPAPSMAIIEFLASNLGVETTDIDVRILSYHQSQK
jgi:hypothetical protein